MFFFRQQGEKEHTKAKIRREARMPKAFALGMRAFTKNLSKA
jgi:hypothetical protein